MPRILLLVALMIGSLSFGQATLTGKCTDQRGAPVENAKVYSASAKSPLIFTDGNGKFELEFPFSDTTVLVIFRTAKMEIAEYVELKQGTNRIKTIKFPFQQEEVVDVNARREDPFDPPVLRPVDWQLVPGGRGVEGYLIYTTAATSNNELTTNYNVRGGSYDENLVYVNGFNVYRPFLTRSGQQEGMSFIYSALVKDIQFSAGGFNAEYGDKLSSVLDITYKTPTATHGSAMASLLGVEAHVEQKVSPRFNYLVGGRYRSNGYLLNSLPTKGAYNPIFWDAQFLTNYNINENLTWSVLGHFSSNNYRFSPETAQTDFGTAQEAYSFRVYFEGQEETQFTTMMGGTSLKYKAGENTNLDFYATVFNTVEEETFDILGEYFINELETDPSKEEFGDSVAVLGIGAFLSHARNKLNATIINLYHNGDHTFYKGYKNDDRTKFFSSVLKWGVNYQMDQFHDKLSEWEMIDSAGYSLPQGNDDQITLFESLKSDLSLTAQRYTGHLQLNTIWSNNKRNKLVTVSKRYKVEKDGKKYKEKRYFSDTIVESSQRWALSVGTRGGYTTANQEFFVTPRAAIKFYPRVYMVKDEKVVRRNVNFHLASGMYYQPPFYREFRTLAGELNLDVKAQKSAHIVGGTDVYFSMWGREVPFKFTAEAYYKYMWDVNPYEIDNVRTRYYANNDAIAYAYGLDMNVHGQFVEGIESFFKIGFLRTQEDILDDFYYEYYNSDGEKIIFGFSENQEVVDTVRVEPGYVPRPTDQWMNFGALIQDRMPGFESFSVQMGMQYGAPLPYGPPDYQRYKDTLRLKSYFRVDLGMSYDFLYKEKKKENFFTKNFTDASISFEVFNLLGINNVLSKQWVQDTQGRYYSIPNFLTQRRYNLKLILRF